MFGRNELVKVYRKQQIIHMKNNGINEVKARFDKVAAEWDANPGRIELARAVGDAIRKVVPLNAGMKIMDFGAGTGLLTLALLPYVQSVTAVDASGEMLRVLEQKLKSLRIDNIKTLQSDICNMPVPDPGYDLIVSSMVLHHIPDVSKALQKLRPCLVSNGRIALADLDSEDGTFHADSTGVFHHGFDRNQVCGWLNKAGFVDTASQDAYRIVRASTSGQSHEYPVFLVTGAVPV